MSAILAFVATSFEVSYNLYMIINYAIAWGSAKRLANWLNRMNELDQDLSRLCPECWHKEMKEFSRIVWIYVVSYVIIPSLVFGSAMVRTRTDWNLPGLMVLLIVNSFAPQFSTFSPDALLILMFRILEKALRSVILKESKQ
jgi:hypothetical protein